MMAIVFCGVSMFYEDLKDYKDSAFQRYTGLKRSTFETLWAVLQEAEHSQRRRGGPKPIYPTGHPVHSESLFFIELTALLVASVYRR